jgi:hypothetical protein
MNRTLRLSYLATRLSAGVLAVLASSPLLWASNTDPVITNVSIHYTNNTLTISGSNLLGYYGAGVCSVSLPSTNLTLHSDSPTSIVAVFPAS